MKTQYDMTEIAGWVATLPYFFIRQFRRKYDFEYKDAAYYTDVFELVGILGPFNATGARKVLINDIDTAKYKIKEYLASIEVADAENIK